MTYTGSCQCGGVQFELRGEPKLVSICHCVDCRRSSGAPMMAWAEYAEDAVTVSKGAPKTINSSGASMRSFCPDCGTGLFYRNAEILPGVVEVQLATFDVDGKLAPAMQIVTAQRVAWASDLSTIPAHEGFPE